jgi:hypothetical protein
MNTWSFDAGAGPAQTENAMSTHRTVSDLAGATIRRTAGGHIDFHAYDARARAERAAAFGTAFAALARRLRAALPARAARPVRKVHRDAMVRACSP